MATFSPEIKLLLGRVVELRGGEVVLERLRRPSEAYEAEYEGEEEDEIEVVVETLSPAELAERKLVQLP